jgi:uncharacterized cupredoxin-like copper-binding protein
MTSPNRLACAFVLVAAVAGSAYAQSAEQTVDVALSDFAFTPKVLHLQRGTPYRLHLVNKSGKGHDFEAYELFENSQVAPGDKGKIDDGKIEVSKGQAVDVRFIPLKSGTFKIKCTHPFHSMLGMTGEAVVD